MILALATTADLGKALYLAHITATLGTAGISNGGPAHDDWWHDATPDVRFVWIATARELVDRHEF
jgi:hypothetical protein